MDCKPAKFLNSFVERIPHLWHHSEAPWLLMRVENFCFSPPWLLKLDFLTIIFCILFRVLIFFSKMCEVYDKFFMLGWELITRTKCGRLGSTGIKEKSSKCPEKMENIKLNFWYCSDVGDFFKVQILSSCLSISLSLHIERWRVNLIKFVL